MLYGLHVQEAALGEQPRWNYNAMNIGLSPSDMSKRFQIVKTATRTTRLENLETIQTITCSALLLVWAYIWQSYPPTKWTSIYSLKASICRNSNIRAGDAEFCAEVAPEAALGGENKESGSWFPSNVLDVLDVLKIVCRPAGFYQGGKTLCQVNVQWDGGSALGKFANLFEI